MPMCTASAVEHAETRLADSKRAAAVLADLPQLQLPAPSRQCSPLRNQPLLPLPPACLQHLVERPFHMRDPSGKLWDCVLIQRKNKVGRGSAGSEFSCQPALAVDPAQACSHSGLGTVPARLLPVACSNGWPAAPFCTLPVFSLALLCPSSPACSLLSRRSTST